MLPKNVKLSGERNGSVGRALLLAKGKQTPQLNDKANSKLN